MFVNYNSSIYRILVNSLTSRAAGYHRSSIHTGHIASTYTVMSHRHFTVRRPCDNPPPPFRNVSGQRPLYEELWRTGLVAPNRLTPRRCSKRTSQQSTPQYKLDCAQGTQTSAKASHLNQRWSGIRIQIYGLIHIRIRIYISLPKCCGLVTLSASVISSTVVKID